MFDLKKTYGFSKAKADAGVRMVVGADPENDYVLVRRIPNDLYRTKLSEVMLANKKMLEILKTQDVKAHAKRDNEIFCEVLAETVLVGWGPGFGVDGKVVAHSVEAAKEMLIDYPDFRGDVVEFASDRINYLPEADIADIKKK